MFLSLENFHLVFTNGYDVNWVSGFGLVCIGIYQQYVRACAHETRSPTMCVQRHVHLLEYSAKIYLFYKLGLFTLPDKEGPNGCMSLSPGGSNKCTDALYPT